MFNNILFFPNCERHQVTLVQQEIAYIKLRINALNKGIDEMLVKWSERYNDSYTSGKMKRDIDETILNSMNNKLIKNINRLAELCNIAA